MAAVVAAWLLLPAAAAAKDVPYLSGRVVDEAGLLSAAAKQRIDGELAALERQTGGDQVAVLIVPSLDGEPLEEYSVKVAHTWKLGRKGKDDGVLLFISRDDRKLRIEVGYGLEGKLTDLQSHAILDEVIRPRFKEGDFDGGVERGVDAIAKALNGQPLPPPAAAGSAAGGRAARQSPLFYLVFGLVFVVVVGTFSAVAVVSRGCQSWFLYVFLAPFYLAFPAAVFGPLVGTVLVGLWLIVFPILKNARRNQVATPAKPGQAPKGIWGGFVASVADGGGGGGGGGFSSGGDFSSGGGGDFGGGGASGGW
jgi:uncharacterized protein